MNWDALQRDVLATMGYTLYRAVTPAVPDHPLLHALLRAAGRDADAMDANALCREWGPPAALRTSAAKRALWPRLRALRSVRAP
ncbi:MAG: hypothetical protein ACREO8_00110 [Luteimonas sp.]